MSIWLYQDQCNSPEENTIRSDKCIFCKCNLKTIYKETSTWNNHIKEINVCPICGWWAIWESSSNIVLKNDRLSFNLYGTSAVLKKLSLMDIEQPIDEIRQYLLVKYEDRFTMHPRLFEETVESVFKNIGFQTIITSYHNDGGIDVILNDGISEIGVQVKRYKDSIQVSQIREFLGALIENGMTHGIFVTTSKFQKGAYNSIEKFSEQKYKIELMDSDRFYDALKLSGRNLYKNYEDFKDTYGDIELSTVYEDESDYS